MHLSLPERLKVFLLPLVIFFGLSSASVLEALDVSSILVDALLLFIVILGSAELVLATIQSLLHRSFALDYIALFAIAVALLTHNYFVAAVIVLMLSGGQTLEKYSVLRAQQSLTALASRLPTKVLVITEGQERLEPIDTVQAGARILVRRGEVLPLDGVLDSMSAAVDESTLTGEAFPVEKRRGDLLRSGTVNAGDVLTMQVKSSSTQSTYSKILAMVRQAQEEKSPFLRLADQYSMFFTFVTAVIAGATFFFTQDPERVLAVLVLATPCPLILATPIALMGGVNAAAHHRIIIKRLASLEVLARVTTLIFDKTGTLTLGQPSVRKVEVGESDQSEDTVVQIMAAIERNSLHPIAKAILAEAARRNLSIPSAQNVHEQIGSGIFGTVDGIEYQITKSSGGDGIAIILLKGTHHVASIFCDDIIKDDAANSLMALQSQGFALSLFTGDSSVRARMLEKSIGVPISIMSDCSPAEKLGGIKQLKETGAITAMIGDGINDAPALAAADVGLVFAHHEQTAASEAGDVIFFGSKLEMVESTLSIARNTLGIATQSIVVGIGLSIVGMIAAAYGYIPPIAGALTQEVIDVAVILNALRASRIRVHAHALGRRENDKRRESIVHQ